jgi:hypothetical protein
MCIIFILLAAVLALKRIMQQASRLELRIWGIRVMVRRLLFGSPQLLDVQKLCEREALLLYLCVCVFVCVALGRLPFGRSKLVEFQNLCEHKHETDIDNKSST